MALSIYELHGTSALNLLTRAADMGGAHPGDFYKSSLPRYLASESEEPSKADLWKTQWDVCTITIVCFFRMETNVLACLACIALLPSSCEVRIMSALRRSKQSAPTFGVRVLTPVVLL